MTRIRTSRADRRGSAAVELALVAPVLLLLILGAVDIATWIRRAYRLDEVVTGMAEIVTRCTALDDPGDFAVFDQQAQVLAGTTDISSNAGGTFIVSAIGNVGGRPTVLWQKRNGNPLNASHFGAPNGAAITGAYQVTGAEVLIGIEAFSSVQPWAFGIGLARWPATSPIYARAMFLVRSSNSAQLAVLASGNAAACGS